MIIAYVMQSCPDCNLVKQEAPNYPNLKIVDIGEHVRNLKQFLAIRDTHPAFDSIRGTGKVGIPCFVLENKNISFTYNEVREILISSTEATEIEQDYIIGESCNINDQNC